MFDPYDDEQLTVGENIYFVDTTDESINKVDWWRVLKQDKLISTNMPLLPDDFDPSDKKVLDVACGPFGWGREVVRKYPDVAEIHGFDNSRPVIAYARNHEATKFNPRVHLHEMNILEPWKFPDSYFDYVNARFVVSVLPNDKWTWMLDECRRVLKPGGVIRLTECEMSYLPEDECPFSCQLMNLITDSFWILGKSFSRRELAITPVLRRVLDRGGFANITIQDKVLDWSHGTPLHDAVVENMVKVMETAKPLIMRAGNLSEAEYGEMHSGVLKETSSNKFFGLWPVVGFYAYKPK